MNVWSGDVEAWRPREAYRERKVAVEVTLGVKWGASSPPTCPPHSSTSRTNFSWQSPCPFTNSCWCYYFWTVAIILNTITNHQYCYHHFPFLYSSYFFISSATSSKDPEISMRIKIIRNILKSKERGLKKFLITLKYFCTATEVADRRVEFHYLTKYFSTGSDKLLGWWVGTGVLRGELYNVIKHCTPTCQKLEDGLLALFTPCSTESIHQCSAKCKTGYYHVTSPTICYNCAVYTVLH